MLAAEEKTEESKYKDTTQKILKNFPEQRTLLVINFDLLFEKSFLKEIFQVHGKVRRIFNERIVSKNKTRKKKDCFLSIVVFKNRIDMVKLFDVEHFQFQLVKKFHNRFHKMTEMEQKETFEKYFEAIKNQVEIDGSGFLFILKKYFFEISLLF